MTDSMSYERHLCELIDGAACTACPRSACNVMQRGAQSPVCDTVCTCSCLSVCLSVSLSLSLSLLTGVVTCSDAKKSVSSSEADAAKFDVGAEVQIFALQSAAGQKLNGLPGVVTANPGANGRYTVKLVVCAVTRSKQ